MSHKRMAAVQLRADDSCRFGLEVGVRPLPEHDLVHMVPNIKVWITLPGGEPEVERRKHRALLVSGDEVQLRLDEPGTGLRARFCPQTRRSMRYSEAGHRAPGTERTCRPRKANESDPLVTWCFPSYSPWASRLRIGTFNQWPSLCVSQGTASKLADDITIPRIARGFCESCHIPECYLRCPPKARPG